MRDVMAIELNHYVGVNGQVKILKAPMLEGGGDWGERSFLSKRTLFRKSAFS